MLFMFTAITKNQRRNKGWAVSQGSLEQRVKNGGHLTEGDKIFAVFEHRTQTPIFMT